MSRGTLITIEGIDGAGKSTLAAGLDSTLRARGFTVKLLREPGGVQTAERLRDLLKDPRLEIGARAEVLLYAAARAQLVQEALGPLLRDETVVLLDRFVDSSLAYQGAGRELGIESVRAINEFATGGLRPARTLLLSLDPPLGRSRSRTRPDPIDRHEREDDQFFSRVAAAYEALASAEPRRIRVIDAGQAREKVLAAALAELEDLL